MDITRTSDKGCLNTAPDSVLEVEQIHLCLEEGYTAPSHRWQLRPEQVVTSWCLPLLDHSEGGSHFDVLHETGNPSPQKLVDLA